MNGLRRNGTINQGAEVGIINNLTLAGSLNLSVGVLWRTFSYLRRHDGKNPDP